MKPSEADEYERLVAIGNRIFHSVTVAPEEEIAVFTTALLAAMKNAGCGAEELVEVVSAVRRVANRMVGKYVVEQLAKAISGENN